MSDGFRFCSLPDTLILEAGLSAWRKRVLRWTITGALPGVPEAEQRRVYERAWSWWAEVCGIEVAYTDAAREADVRMGSGVIDGRGRTLAWSELPNGSDLPLKQMYDSSESWEWVLERDAHAAGRIPLVVTAAHEIGHALGLGHSQNAADLMAPTLNVQAWKPQAGDIREAMSRYGAPRPIPVPPLPAPPVPPIPVPPGPPVPGVGIVLRLFPETKVVEIPSGWQPRYPS